jgi:hypothetical protein
MTLRNADLALALDYALIVLGKYEAPDSRAVTDEFVAMAAISCDCANEACREILRNAIAIEAQRAVTVKQGAVRSTKARACKASPNSAPMNTPTHEGDVE